MWDFNSDQMSGGNTVLPKGEYNVIVEKYDIRTSKSGNELLALTFIITDGDFKGKKIYKNFMLSGNEKAVEIARGQLKTVLHVCNKGFNIAGPHEFVGLELAAGVKIVTSENGDRNEIGYFKPKKVTASSVGEVLF